jgi:hypothetical protein
MTSKSGSESEPLGSVLGPPARPFEHPWQYHQLASDTKVRESASLTASVLEGVRVKERKLGEHYELCCMLRIWWLHKGKYARASLSDPERALQFQNLCIPVPRRGRLHSMSLEVVIMATMRMGGSPAAVAKHDIEWIGRGGLAKLHDTMVWVELHGVVGNHRVVPEVRVCSHEQSTRGAPRGERCSPDVRYDGRALGDEVPILHIVVLMLWGAPIVEDSIWEPLGNVPEEKQEVFGKGARRKNEVEISCGR